jgi:hypothetical protein
MALIHEVYERTPRATLARSSEVVKSNDKTSQQPKIVEVFSDKSAQVAQAQEKAIRPARFFMPEMLE